MAAHMLQRVTIACACPGTGYCWVRPEGPQKENANIARGET